MSNWVFLNLFKIWGGPAKLFQGSINFRIHKSINYFFIWEVNGEIPIESIIFVGINIFLLQLLYIVLRVLIFKTSELIVFIDKWIIEDFFNHFNLSFFLWFLFIISSIFHFLIHPTFKSLQSFSNAHTNNLFILNLKIGECRYNFDCIDWCNTLDSLCIITT